MNVTPLNICRIIIVDDSDHDRAEAKAALLNGSPRRWEFLEASTGDEALRLCSLEPAADCMVLDFNLPDATALQVLAAMVRGEEDLIRIPVVILTNYTSAITNQEILRAGAQDYVGKSWLCPESLTRAVENAMELHAMTRTLRRHAKRREQLLEAERAARVEGERVGLIKDEFLATVTHELRTPLASIISWSNLLKMSLDNPEIVQRCVEVIVGSAGEQAALVADLLDMNRIVSGKMRMESELVDIDLVASTAADTLSLMVAAKGVALALSLGCGPDVRIRGDAGRLRQVLWNLLTNAVKFTPSGGGITLATAVVGDEVTIQITDSGNGIDPAYMPFLFDRFTQADGSRARAHGGLGLGLSIVKSLVECHGGTVVGSSLGVGQGASFVLRFPMVRPGSGEIELDVTSPGTPTLFGQKSDSNIFSERTCVLKGVSILLVDDVPETLSLLQRLLSEFGAVVRIACSAQHALEQITAHCPDVLLSDISMPGTNGYELIEEIRLKLGLDAQTLPAAAVSAYARPQDHARALQAGYQACIKKPIDELLLIRTVLTLLRSGRNLRLDRRLDSSE